MTDIHITVYMLQNQVNNMWDISMIYRSKRHLGKEVRRKTCSSSPTTKLLEGKLFSTEVQGNMGNVTKVSHKV
jgi:hypothetical protein